jgi:hypothetical protein
MSPDLHCVFHMRSRSMGRLIGNSLIACIFVVAWIQFSIVDSPVALVLGQWGPELVGDLQTMYNASVKITNKAMGSYVENKLETGEERSTTVSVRQTKESLHLHKKKEEIKTTTLFPPNMFWTARDAKSIRMNERGMLSPGNAEHITGPKMFTRAVVEYLAEQGRLRPDQVTVLDTNVVHINDANITADTDEQVGNLLILHKNAFGYHRMHPPVANRERYIRHLFAGRWRVKSRDG